MPIKILHVHPSLRMAKIFISPLMEAESKNGYITKLMTSKNNNIIKKKRVQANYRRWILLEEAPFIAVTRLPDRPRSRRKK